MNPLVVTASREAPLDATLEREALAAAAEALAPLFADGAGPRMGLIVASNNAGSASSLRFWRDAMRTGVALASPELFPWCLANAACGALARHFGVSGPNATLLGEADALEAAFETAADWIGQRRAEVVVVIAISFADERRAGLALGWRMCGGGEVSPERGLAADATLREAIGRWRAVLAGAG